MASSEKGAAGSIWWQPLFADIGRTRLWALVSAGFLIVGCLSLGERAWALFVDWRARQTWPNADGEIIAATQQNDSDLSRKYGTIRGRTRYWVEYDVRFAGPPARCRTDVVPQRLSESMPCQGIARTRSTQSSAEAFQWFLRGYQVNEHVRVLWDPEAIGSVDVKIVGEPLWLRYNLDRLILSVGWVLGFGALFLFSRRRLAYLSLGPERRT